ncbi:hypothetical protein L873DRAFT_1848971 [Choiromyces venosus 120613-1]|uniref:Uncharacterized protein n=1 Tax=Choiromyces venosus 120613-1 TaxID=1336337 RepID=A0A3N4IZ91_9PEZI|nr:hypothetical protein L873DRAFT_1848971 [Choiromyces venosus 120613-1]
MNTGSSSSGNSAREQAEEGRHATSREGHQPTPENPAVGNPAAHAILSPHRQLAHDTREKIEHTVSIFPRLAEQCEEYLTQETQHVADAYSGGVTNGHPVEAQKLIEESIARMETFHNDMLNRWPALRAGRRRAISGPSLRHPAPGSSGQAVGSSALTAHQQQEQPQSTPSGLQPGTRPPVIFVAVNPPSQTGESGTVATRPEQAQQQYRSWAVLPAVPENNPTEHGMMDPRAGVTATSQPLDRRATWGAAADTMGIPESPAVTRVRRSLNLTYVVGALRSPGESKRMKVKDLWKRARDRLRKPDPNP